MEAAGVESTLVEGEAVSRALLDFMQAPIKQHPTHVFVKNRR